MIKELEEVVDVPCVHICTVVPISLTVGANRIDPAVAIPHPLGNPQLQKKEEYQLRRRIIEKALQALTTDVTEQTVF
jgi:glycine reductase